VKQLKTGLTGVFICLLFSCCSLTTKKVYCGYELTGQEYAHLQKKIELQKSAYEADSGGHIYEMLDDSIRSAMPDSVEFEIFLSLLNSKEVGVDIIVPDNKEYFERIGCAIMNADFTDKMPDQRYMCLYTYTRPDGSGDSPLKVAIKRNR